jgi:hypothetical protein
MGLAVDVRDHAFSASVAFIAASFLLVPLVRAVLYALRNPIGSFGFL